MWKKVVHYCLYIDPKGEDCHRNIAGVTIKGTFMEKSFIK